MTAHGKTSSSPETKIRFIVEFIDEHPFYAFGFILAILLICNIQVIAYPPFGDEITGVHNQAIYLVKHDFNPSGLYHPSESYLNGGSGIYPFGILPWLFAFFYRIFPITVVHILTRMTSLAAAAGGLVFLFRICSLKKLNAVVTILCAAAAALLPVFSGQAVSAGQEMPTALFIMASFYYFFKDRYYMAYLLGFLACFVKFTAVVLPMSYVLWSLSLLLICPNKKESMKQLLAALAATVPVIFLNLSFQSTVSCSCRTDIQELFYEILNHCLFLLPWLIPLAILILIFLITEMIFWKRTSGKPDFRLIVFLFFIGGFFAAYFLQSSMWKCPRYTVITVLPIFAVTAILLRRFEKTAGIVFAFLTIFNILNQQGALYLKMPLTLGVIGASQERSREYLEKIENDMKVARYMEKKDPDLQVVCTWCYPQILTVPEFGYVKKNVPGIITGPIFPKYAAALPLSEWNPGKKTVCLFEYPVIPPFMIDGTGFNLKEMKHEIIREFRTNCSPVVQLIIIEGLEELMRELKRKTYPARDLECRDR